MDLGMVKDIRVSGEKVLVSLALTTLACPLKDGSAASAREAILALAGISDVDVDLMAMSPGERDRAVGKAESHEGGKAQQFNHIGQVVAVMSGKGGVGKSLVTGLLAVALARDGKKVGILDADVTGPSMPKMFGLWQRPEGSPVGILPVPTRLGIRVMSINLLLEREDEAVIWRGPRWVSRGL